MHLHEVMAKLILLPKYMLQPANKEFFLSNLSVFENK